MQRRVGERDLDQAVGAGALERRACERAPAPTASRSRGRPGPAAAPRGPRAQLVGGGDALELAEERGALGRARRRSTPRPCAPASAPVGRLAGRLVGGASARRPRSARHPCSASRTACSAPRAPARRAGQPELVAGEGDRGRPPRRWPGRPRRRRRSRGGEQDMRVALVRSRMVSRGSRGSTSDTASDRSSARRASWSGWRGSVMTVLPVVVEQGPQGGGAARGVALHRAAADARGSRRSRPRTGRGSSAARAPRAAGRELAQRVEHGVAARRGQGRLVGAGRGRAAAASRAAWRTHDRPVPQRRAGAVDHGLPQVGQRLVGVAQPRPAAVHRDERVLHDLLGGAHVADQQHRQPDQRAPVRGVQLLERRVGVPRRSADRSGTSRGSITRAPGTESTPIARA